MATHPQPGPDISKMDYAPIGFYKPGLPIPSPSTPPTNPDPSGKWVAYDTDIFESLNFPSRQAGDSSAGDAPGSGDPRYGFCPPNDPAFLPYGKCANHQLEYLDYFERAMKEILGPYGVTVKRYGFQSPGINVRPGTPAAPSTAPGQSYNVAAVVPGADHPDETVLVSGHYDVTDSAPAPAWDSAEGHAEVIRMAKIMADYWRATGTRPAATIKFIPWDQEESGTLGSIDYIAHDIPPGEAGKIRGYFNVDPCAGAYPAFRNGIPPNRVPEVLQLADPANFPAGSPERARIERFNSRASSDGPANDIVDEVFAHLAAVDPGLTTPAGPMKIYTPDQRSEVGTAVGGLAIFSSDYANFEALGVPIFNLFPDYFGPHADGTPASAEGVGILHSPRDNLTTLNSLTNADPTGLQGSEGWAKGMEMCAQVESWYMLQPEMSGGQAVNSNPVAYYEALPNPALKGQNVTFDAGGSYQYSSPAGGGFVDPARLSFSWDFGDGSTGSGASVQHSFAAVGRYVTKLTVTNRDTGTTDSMSLPVTVTASNFAPPRLDRPQPTGPGSFRLNWSFTADRDGFKEFSVDEARDYRRLVDDDAEGDINARWTPSANADPQLQPWQSSQGSPAANGNQRYSGESSYWTGAFPTAPSPTNEESDLTLKRPIAVPREGEPELSFWSLFQSEGDDLGRVEVALTDGNPSTQPQWKPLGDPITGIYDPSDPATFSPSFSFHAMDLSPFKGKQILLRFRYILGPDDRALSQPAGWYIDDIRADAGTFLPIGTATAKTFLVQNRPAGSYAYRVRGVYRDGVSTAPSNAEPVTITSSGAVLTATPLAARACAAAAGFDRAAAKPLRRGLRLDFTPRVRAPVSVDIMRQSSGRRVLRLRRVARFQRRTNPFVWNGRANVRRQRVGDGLYVVVFRIRTPSGSTDVRRIVVERRRGRFKVRPPFELPPRCGLISRFALGRAAFGGIRSRALTVRYRLRSAGRVKVEVIRGRRVVRRFRAVARRGGVTYRLRLPALRLRRGDYRVRLTATRGSTRERASITARRL